MNVHFEDILEKSPEPDWRHEGTNHGRNTLAKKDHDNAAKEYSLHTLATTIGKQRFYESENRKYRCQIQHLQSIPLNFGVVCSLVHQQTRKIDKDSDEVLSIILDMRNIYTEYLNRANEADNT